MYFSHSTGNIITNNSILSNRYDGLWLSYSDNNEVSGNTLVNNLGEGFRVVDSNGNLIADNAVVNGAAGTNIVDSAWTVISDNLVVNQTWGILLQFSPNSTITGGIVRDCVHGIFLLGSDNGTVRNATMKWNDRGLRVYHSDWNTIEGNLILSNSEYGISLEAPLHNNSIFHNEIIGNAVQAYDDGFMNQWDNGYPSGGNYWSDYNGTDSKSGPSQTDPGSDGIGDTPYDIDGDSQDRYPLMNSSTVVPPRPPTVIGADLSGNGLENVTVRWSLSPDDGAGMDTVENYAIWRGSSYDTDGAGYQLLGYVDNGIDTYVDALAGEGDPNNYFYGVTAMALSGQEAYSRTQAGKITRPLALGPNLISVPLIQSNESIETVLQTVKYDNAWLYNSSSQEWKWFMKSKEYRRGLYNINHAMGIWVNVTQNSNLTVAGVIPAQTIIHLQEGWNLVSFPSYNSSYTVADLKAEAGATRVEGYDLTPPYRLRVVGDVEVLQAGYGYWVRVDAAMDWIVEVS